MPAFPDSLLVPIHSWVERGTVRVKCLAQEHNKMTRPGLEPGPLDLESIVLTSRPLRLPILEKAVEYFSDLSLPKHIFFAIFHFPTYMYM